MSPTQFPCVEGTWTNLTNLISQEECYVCPKGFFCLRGVSTPSGLCFTGHYCPRGMHTVAAAHLALVGLAFIEPRQLSLILSKTTDQHTPYTIENLVTVYKAC